MVNTFTTPVTADVTVRTRHLARRIAVSLISILLVLSAGTIAYLAFLDHTVTTNVKHAALLPRLRPRTRACPSGNPQSRTRRTSC
jgi:hypothetical protein